MKEVSIFLIAIGATILLLRAEVLPWRLVPRDEFIAMQEELASARTAQATARKSTGAWMHDPNYRTALEKSTIISVPEAAKRRDH